jgi:hypothetical protein
MSHGSRTAPPPGDPAGAVTRRELLEHGARYGLGFAGASLLAPKLWLPEAAAGRTDGALGDGDPALQAQGTQRA